MTAVLRTVYMPTLQGTLTQTLKWVDQKDPDSTLDYTLDLTQWLGSDTILSAAAVVAPNYTGDIVITSISNTKTKVTVWLTGGNVGTNYAVTFNVITNGNRTLNETIWLFVQNLSPAPAVPVNIQGIIPTIDNVTIISNNGTISAVGGGGGLPSIASGQIIANVGTSNAVPDGEYLTTVLDSVFGSGVGTLLHRGASGWGALSSGTATQVLTCGTSDIGWSSPGTGTSTTSTLAISLIDNPLPASYTYEVLVAQSGTLYYSGAGGYCNAHPTYADHVSLSTRHGDTINNLGTINVSTTGSITIPVFLPVALSALDGVRITTKGTPDITGGCYCFAFPFTSP